MKDWTGNQKTMFTTIGASSHSQNQRQSHDFYATDPNALSAILKTEKFNNVWEPSCGLGHLSDVLIKHGIHARSTDLIDRGYQNQSAVMDFLSINNTKWDGDIITNPPFRYAQEFVQKSIQIIPKQNRVMLLLRIQFLEGKERKLLFKTNPPQKVIVSSSRIQCAINGNFKPKQSSAACYAWFIWQKGYNGNTILEWFN